MFLVFLGRLRCFIEKFWVRFIGGLVGVNRREGRVGVVGYGESWFGWCGIEKLVCLYVYFMIVCFK